MLGWDSNMKSPFVFLVAGIGLLVVSLAGIWKGRVIYKFGWASRDESPFLFWCFVAVYSFAGIQFIRMYFMH